MAGGGAERHTINIINHAVEKGWTAEIILTAMKRSEIVTLFNLDSSVPVVYIPDEINESGSINPFNVIYAFAIKCFTWLHCHAAKTKIKPKWLLKAEFVASNCTVIRYLRKRISKSSKSDVLLTVLDGPTFQTLFANKIYKRRHIIAEFADPERRIKSSQLVKMMFEKYYPRTNHVLFQSPGAKVAFNNEVQAKGVIIPNPLIDGLPEPFTGERKKEIVNFCRFSPQKNIPLLLKAFKRLNNDHPDYKLIVFGGATNPEEFECLHECEKLIKKLEIEPFVSFPGFCDDIHEKILDAAMFVSSSDYEGLSNSMIEAMAIGLPTVCTDCPAGGASYIIADGENGLLTPVGDADALYDAMKRVIEDKELAKRISTNGYKIRSRLKLETIAEEWMKAIDD